MISIMSTSENKKIRQELDIVRQKYRGKQMKVADLQSENALLKKSLFYLNRAKVAQDIQGSDSCSVPLSDNLEANSSQPSTSFQVSRTLRQSERLPPLVSASGLQVHSEVQQSQNDQVQPTQQFPKTSPSQAQALPAKSSVQVTHQQQPAVTDLEEIESFFHIIQNQLQSSSGEENKVQAAGNSRLSQQPSNHSGEHIEENVEVTCVTSVRAVQSYKRTQTQQPLPRDEAKNACQTTQQPNLKRTPLSKQTNNTFIHKPHTIHYHALQSSHSPQSQEQAHMNSAQNHQFPQPSLQQYVVQRCQNPEQIPKNTTQNFQGPRHYSQQVFAQRPQNLQQNHPSQHPQRLQQVHNSVGHNMHPPLGSPQSHDQRIHNAYQIQNPANSNVCLLQQHLQRASFPQPSYGNSNHRFPPPQYSPHQHFQRPHNPQNLKPSHHSQSGRSIQEHPFSQQSQQKPQVPSPPLLQIQQSPGQTNQASILGRQPFLKNLQRPQESPDYSYQRPNHVSQCPLFRAPLLPKQRYQQPNISAKNTQGAPSSIQQLPSSQGLEQAHIGNLNQFNASQRSPNGSNSKNTHQSGGQDQRISGLNSTVNSIGSKNTYSQSNSQDSPQQNRGPQLTQPQAFPINFQENRQNLPVTGIESTQTNILSRNQQNSVSHPKTSTELTHSCNQSKGLSDDREVRTVQSKSNIKFQEKQREFLLHPGIQNMRDVRGPFVEIVKEEPLSDMTENCMETSWQCNNIGKEISIKDSLDVSEFFHLEEITTSVPVAKISHRPEVVVSGTEKRDSSRESSLERNVDIPPHAIITPPQTPPTPIPSTSGRSTSPVLSINTPQVMKKLANQDYTRAQQSMVDSEFIYCNVEEKENSIAIPYTVSNVTEAPSNSLRTQKDTVLQRKKSRGPCNFLDRSVAEDISVENSESEGNQSTTREKCSQESPAKVKFSSRNKENDPKEIAGLKQSYDLHVDHATDLSSASQDNVTRFTKSPDNPIQLVHNKKVPETNKMQDQKLTFSCSEEADKTHEQSCTLSSNSQEERSCVLLGKPQEGLSCVRPDNSQQEITSLEQVGTSSKSSAVECLVIFSSNSAAVHKSNEYISQNKENIDDPLQHVRHSESKRSSGDNDEISHTEYVIESAKSEPLNKNLDGSLLECSLSELHGFVEYVHLTDHSEELEISSPRKMKGANDGPKDFEVSPHASDVTEENWNFEESKVNNDNESSDYLYRIFLCADEVTGRVTNPGVIPECCPMCYTAICPSRIRVNTDTFDMTTVCIGCELTILMSWTTKADAGINKRRPGPKSRRHSGPKPKRPKCNIE